MRNCQWVFIEPESNAVVPGARWGHSCCVVNYNLYIFGGFANSNYMNDLWMYSLKTKSWEKINTFGDIPEQRSNATLNYDSINHQLILFGGGGFNKQRFNSISVLDLNNLNWVELIPFENQSSPWQRTYHTAQFIFPYLIIFGGQGADDLGDLWVYSLQTLLWKEIKFKNGAIRPKSRRFHSSCMIGNQMFIFGGCEGKYTCLSDLYKLDLTSFFETGEINNLQWHEIKLSQNIARWGQTSNLYNGNIYIFAGRSVDDLQDLVEINPNTGKVEILETKSLPKARRRHSGCFIGSCLVIFGGFDGNYFNDLFYANLYNMNNLNNRNRIVTEQITFFDHIIKTKEGDKMNINTYLIGRYFNNEDQLVEFIQKIDQFYNKNKLEVILNTFYNGYGPLPLARFHKILLKKQPFSTIYSHQQRIASALHIKHLPTLEESNNYNQKAIQLQKAQLQNYLQNLYQSWLFNDSIKINNSNRIKISKGILASKCKYFKNLFYSGFKQQQKISFPIYNNMYPNFQLIFAYFYTNIFAVPKNISYKFFIQTAQLAQFFNANQLLAICQNELIRRLDIFNFKELIEISKIYEFNKLSQKCSFMILNEVAQNTELQEQSLKMMDKNTYKLYNLFKFDYAHKKSSKGKMQDKNIQSNKQNILVNGLPRKTSSSYQK